MGKKENYLDKVPAIAVKKWNELEGGIVEVVVENKGFYNFIAQKVFHKPRFSFIKLDEYGSCVWKEIDGQKNIYQIGEILGKTHKGAKDKLYERLSVFMRILEKNHYITFQ